MSDGRKNNARKNAGKSNPGKFEGKFVRCELSTEDKQRLAKQEFDTDRVFDQLHALVAAGYKFSVSLQSDQSAYLASLYDRDQDSSAVGYTLTGRGRSVPNAIAALFYKHFDLLDGVWPTQGLNDEEWG